MTSRVVVVADSTVRVNATADYVALWIMPGFNATAGHAFMDPHEARALAHAIHDAAGDLDGGPDPDVP